MSFPLALGAPATRRATTHASNPNLVLGLILAAYLMIVLDVSVIITALPSIHTALHFSSASLSWVQNAYALTFGGLLLLGARAGDILGRRRVFMVGIALFSTSPRCWPAWRSRPTGCWPRARVQGVGAAIAAPSTLALLTTTFREGTERTRALAWYTAVAGGGGSAGLVLGGMLTDWVVLALGHVHQRAGRPVGDVPGAASSARDRAASRPLRPDRRDHLDARHERGRLRLRPRRLRRLGRPRDRRVVRRRRRVVGGLHPQRDARRAADHAAAPVRQP